MKKSNIGFELSLDENMIPETIEWSASDSAEGGSCDAVLMSIWDANEKNTLKIDLWTKKMTVDDMKMLAHQTILTLSETYERATGDSTLAKELKDFGLNFGEKAGLIKRGE